MVPPRLESDCGPLVHIFTYSSGFPQNVKKLHTYVKRLLIPGQTFKLSTRASYSKNFKRPKIFRRPQISSKEISGPKVALVLLCKFSLYQAVRARAMRLQPYQPHGWSGPDHALQHRDGIVIIDYCDVTSLYLYSYSGRSMRSFTRPLLWVKHATEFAGCRSVHFPSSSSLHAQCLASFFSSLSVAQPEFMPPVRTWVHARSHMGEFSRVTLIVILWCTNGDFYYIF